MTRGDLLALVDQAAQDYQQQPGEYTRAELLGKCGGQEWKLKSILARLKAEGRLKTRRIIGSKVVYRLDETERIG